MAVTKTCISIKSTLKSNIDYICNSEKTDGKPLVSSHGCAAETGRISNFPDPPPCHRQGNEPGASPDPSLSAWGGYAGTGLGEIGMELGKEILGGKYEFTAVLTTRE